MRARRKTKAATEMRDPEVRVGVRRTNQLAVEVERLAHNLNVHLDQIQTLIHDRKATL